jgi:hypothetical protein
MEWLDAFINTIPLIAGLRYFGREFWPQLLFAVLLTTYLQAGSFERDYGDVAEWWRLAIFAGINALSASVLYALDKRFKLTHWEKNPE